MTDATSLEVGTSPSFEPGIAICLSGGGFRATLFNLGSLWRLNEYGLLPKLKMITSVSGGSIVSGLLGLRWKNLSFDAGGCATNFQLHIADPIQAFCARKIAVPAAIGGILNPFKSIGDEMSEAYESLYGKATLQDLPDGQAPQFVLYATSLQTGRSVRMGRSYLADYLVGKLPHPNLSLARAVAASSAFPPCCLRR
ncbi:MAG: patatin-like phospholipase family protein [Betaproteobacteria bacterium]|nr:patatin-like phospholipase family protein [Betaproteobacteria bacterium]